MIQKDIGCGITIVGRKRVRRIGGTPISRGGITFRVMEGKRTLIMHQFNHEGTWDCMVEMQLAIHSVAGDRKFDFATVFEAVEAIAEYAQDRRWI
jgi:hypothetical protein